MGPRLSLNLVFCKDLEALLLDEPDHVTRETTNFFKRILKALPNVRLYSYLAPIALPPPL